LISLGIPKLVRFDKTSPDKGRGITIPFSSDFEVQIISRGVQGWVEREQKPIKGYVARRRSKRSASRRTSVKAA
jgi:hypothetical protein